MSATLAPPGHDGGSGDHASSKAPGQEVLFPAGRRAGLTRLPVRQRTGPVTAPGKSGQASAREGPGIVGTEEETHIARSGRCPRLSAPRKVDGVMPRS